MPDLGQVFNNPAINALGWTLVHFLWQGCVIALFYWLICILAPRHAATLRYWAGLAGMVLSLFVIGLTFLVSYAPEARFDLGSVHTAAVNPFLVLSGSLPDAWVLLESGIEPVLPWVVLFWMLGVGSACIHTAGQWYAIHKLVRESIACSEVQLQLAVENIKARLGVQLAVRLLVSTRVAVPLAIGFLRPVILMPASVLARLPRDQLEMILAHELVHIRRLDFAFNLLQVVLETLLFYHPAIIWMSQRVREEREHCCDDLVVRECGRPATYARALTNLEVMRSPPLGAAVPATGGNLLARIRLIIDNGSHGKKSSGLGQLVLVAIAGVLVAFGAQQGYAISIELNRVAYSAQLQTSDVQWKTWGLSRQVWGQGVNGYAQSVRKKQLAVLKIESLSLQHLVEPDFDIQAIAGLENHLVNPLELENSQGPERINLESLLVGRDLEAVALTVQAPAEGFALTSTQLPFDARAVGTPAFLSQQAPEPQNPQNSKPLMVGVVESEIKPLKSRPPNYPWQARRKGIEGFVELEFSVDAEGRVIDVAIVDAVPEGVFENAASKALLKWTFAGSEESGSRFRQVFDFELQELEKVPRSQRPCVVTGSRTCGQISPGVFVVWVNSTKKSGYRSGLN